MLCAEKYAKMKGYYYITAFCSAGKSFYDFHEKNAGVVMERLTEEEIERKIKYIESKKRCKI